MIGNNFEDFLVKVKIISDVIGNIFNNLFFNTHFCWKDFDANSNNT